MTGSPITPVLWLVTKWPSPTHVRIPPGGGASRHRKCGLHNHTTIIIHSREAKLSANFLPEPAYLSGNFLSPYLRNFAKCKNHQHPCHMIMWFVTKMECQVDKRERFSYHLLFAFNRVVKTIEAAGGICAACGKGAFTERAVHHFGFRP
ncbi:hypothetical protein AVEN_253602-1 [Araneus ventricosus]|uniref:Uncharacterized protein n=1 Tax=Araneus ventricosus TaxID=182803 RepID=A0A4Y2CBF7_ARAVE|nr:hypothetical protein AVEN_253602-1 [Araneus ventricosus]